MFQDSILRTAAVDLPRSLPRTGVLRVFGRIPQWIPLPSTGREYLMWTLIMLLITGLVALQIWLSLRIAETQQTLSTLRVEYRMIEQENAELLWQISQYTSLERIKIEAERMGYGPSFQRDYRRAQAGERVAPSSVGIPGYEAGTALFSLEEVTNGAGALWQFNFLETLEQWWQPHSASIQSLWER
jgi:hypothetical protein